VLLSRAGSTLLALFCSLALVAAQEVDDDIVPPSESELDDLFSFEAALYRQNDNGGGNPFIDEDASIYEALILIRKSIDEDDRAHLRLLGDIVSSASLDAVVMAADATGATGNNPGSLGAAAGWERVSQAWNYGLEVGYANEFAYRSYNVSAHIDRSLLENNTNLALDLRAYRDLVRVIRFNGIEESDEYRTSISGDLAWSQLLTPLSRMVLQWTHTNQEGFLATSFNQVPVIGVPPDDASRYEVVPDMRRRDALTARYKHAVGHEDAIELGYRYYTDDWGIHSHTAQLRYFHFLSARFLIEPNYRYYDQAGADFFSFMPQPPQQSTDLRTADSDLGNFHGNSLGIDLRLLPKTNIGNEYHLGMAYYDRSDGLDYYWIMIGLDVPF
jgi:hypothetical protein